MIAIVDTEKITPAFHGEGQADSGMPANTRARLGVNCKAYLTLHMGTRYVVFSGPVNC